jgi:WD40 repeat protein
LLPEDGPAKSGKSRLDTIEQIAKIFSIVAVPTVIPLAIAFYSAQLQEHAQKETINRDYVQLSVSILKEKKEDVDSELRDWAVSLLSDHSPTKFSPKVITGLKSGALLFPGVASGAPSAFLIAALSPDGRLLATADARSYGITDIIDHKRIMIADTVGRPTALDFSPDGSLLAVGFADGNVSLTPMASAARASTLTVPQPVAAIRLTASGEVHIISSLGSVFIYDSSGKLLRKYLVPNPPTNATAVQK